MELVVAQVERLEPDEMAELHRYLTKKLVATEVQLPEKGQVAQRWRDVAGDVEGVYEQRDNPVRVPTAARNSGPSTEVAGRIP